MEPMVPDELIYDDELVDDDELRTLRAMMNRWTMMNWGRAGGAWWFVWLQTILNGLIWGRRLSFSRIGVAWDVFQPSLNIDGRIGGASET
jgi:hypothetical protein